MCFSLMILYSLFLGDSGGAWLKPSQVKSFHELLLLIGFPSEPAEASVKENFHEHLLKSKIAECAIWKKR